MVAEVTAMINWKSKRRKRVNAAILAVVRCRWPEVFMILVEPDTARYYYLSREGALVAVVVGGLVRWPAVAPKFTGLIFGGNNKHDKGCTSSCVNLRKQKK